MKESDVIYDWSHQPNPFAHRVIELCDESLRDGLQSPSVQDPPLDKKLELIELMAALGITIANIGLPGAGPRAVHDVREIARFVRDQKLPIKVNCAARTHEADLLPIARIQEEIGLPIVAYCFLGASPIRQYVEEWDLDRLYRTTDAALNFAIKNQLEVAFVTEDTTRSHPDTLAKLFNHAISLGVRRLVLCDTVGHATPLVIRGLVEWTKSLIAKTGADVKLDWHGHNDRGLGVSNALAAAEYGCDRIHGTCLGIGERVGNTAMEHLIINLKLMGAYPHPIDRLMAYAEAGSKAVGIPIPYNYPVCGKDAFRTATGVHAAAVIKAEKKGDALLADLIYSSVPAGWIGRHQEIEVGPMSGASNIRYWLNKRKLENNEALVQALLEHAKQSDHVLSDDELYQIIQQVKNS